MHSPLFLLILALGNLAATMQFTGIKHTTDRRAVHAYLARLVPASKNTLLHRLMGPIVGSEVNPCLYVVSSYIFN